MKKFEGIYRESIEEYIHNHLINRPHPIFLEVEGYAKKERVPIVSPITGEAIRYIIEKEGPETILELGTGLGYSILWMLASDKSLKIDTWERNSKCITDAKVFINRYIKSNQIIYFYNQHIIESLEKENNYEKYDLVFVDCDKICYPQILLKLTSSLKSGSKILFDNVLWHGRLDHSIYSRPSDQAMQEFWRIIIENNFNRTLFSLGDGLLLVKI